MIQTQESLTYEQCYPATAAMADIRAFVAGCLRQSGATDQQSELIDDLVLVADELATNAVLHSKSGSDGGHFTLILIITPGRDVRLEVLDEGPAGPDTQPLLTREPGPEDYQRGGLLVQTLAADADAYDDAQGHHAWARFEWRHAA